MDDAPDHFREPALAVPTLGGLRFRAEIQQYLVHEPDLNRRAGAIA